MTHPHDLALLYDLLDARIAPAAAEELRKRIGEEPELAAAWDELKRMRDGLRALPTPPVPSAFLEGVKARAGIVDKAPAKPSPAGKGAPASAAPGAAGTGRVLRMRPWTAAIPPPVRI
jgi:anti-sigma factor RsiW